MGHFVRVRRRGSDLQGDLHYEGFVSRECSEDGAFVVVNTDAVVLEEIEVEETREATEFLV